MGCAVFLQLLIQLKACSALGLGNYKFSSSSSRSINIFVVTFLIASGKGTNRKSQVEMGNETS